MILSRREYRVQVDTVESQILNIIQILPDPLYGSAQTAFQPDAVPPLKPSFDSMLSWIDTNHSLSSNLEEIIQHTTELLRLPEPPDSILCFNSLIAVGVIQAIRQFRLRIPEDISIVSFDNYPYALLITPSLTVVDIDMYSLGTRAGASLLKKIQNPEMLIQTYTALPHLIQRDSSVLRSET